MFRTVLICSMVLAFSVTARSVNAQYGVVWSGWQPHVNGDDGLEFCFNDGLNSKTTIVIQNNSGASVDIRVQSWIDGGTPFDSGVFQMTGTSISYPVNRLVLGTAASHIIKCTVTFSNNGARLFGPSQEHEYQQKDPSECH